MFNGLKQFKLNFNFKLPFIPQLVYYSLIISGFLIITFFIFSPYIPYSINLKPDDIATSTIIAPRYVELETTSDKLKTENLRNERVKLVEKVYSLDENTNKNIIANIVNFFTIAKKYKSESTLESKSLPAPIKFISKTERNYLLNLNNNGFAYLEYVVLQNTEKLLNQKIALVESQEIKKQLKSRLRILNLDKTAEYLLYKIILHYLQPNVLFDEAQTNELIRQEINSIKPFTTVYKKGQPIIYEGEKVVSENIEIMTALNIYGVKANLFQFASIFLIVLFSFVFLRKYMMVYRPEIYQDKKRFLVIYIAFFIVIILAKLINTFNPENFSGNLEYFIPVTITSILISLLVSTNIAIICGMIMSIFLAIMFKFDLIFFFYLFFSCVVASFSTYRSYKRTELIKSGYIIGLANILLILAVGILKDINEVAWYSYNFIFGFGSGVIAAMITLAIIPYLESIFKITTPQSLLELADLNHPLLKQLMVTSSGTYQHSIIVANLSEAAADALKDNIVLARIGSYFHDIGKVKRPLFFAENQFAEENPHNVLNPRMSKIIITSHTKDGLELANKYGLPKLIKDIISQHHGTSLVSFFYTQAAKNDQQIIEAEFRYPGPKPQTKVSGIIMLADSVEAAVRSLKNPGPTKIENCIDNIFTNKINDHQLDDCPVSFQEIKIIKETFLKILKGIYHTRINYDQELKKLSGEFPDDEIPDKE